MSEADAQCAALQQQELDVIRAIYPELITVLPSGEIKLEIPVELGGKIPVRVLDTSGIQSESDLVVHVSQLPSVLLTVNLPTNYPTFEHPRLESAYVTYDWLHAELLREVVRHLGSMWSAGGEGVLDSWIDWIRSGQMLYDLRIRKAETIFITHVNPQVLVPLLLQYDDTVASEAFKSTAYACSICMNSIKGARCIQLKCSHVFCRDCLHDYWTLGIREGTISSVGCADPECVKKGVEATVEEVRRVVASDLVDRWRWLQLKRDADRDPSIIHCPVETCQRPVPRTHGHDADDSSGWFKFRQCQSCGYAFCSFCKRTWHGPVAACAAITSIAIVSEYMGLEENSPQRRGMEIKYGKKTLQRLVTAYKEEQANKEYFESSTRACPGCDTKIQKSMGCNHMTCTRCGQHFCYLCSEKLLASNPYIHFSTRGQGCYNRLFDEKDILENEWQPVDGFQDWN